MRRTLSTIATATASAIFITLGALCVSPASAKDHDDYNSAQSCINPAGHVRGRCRNGAHHSKAISGRVLSVGSVLVQFGRNNGSVIAVNEQPLLAAGAPLVPGRYYSLGGYWANGIFYATAIRSWSY